MISWLKEKMVWLVGAIIALITVYLFGRKDGKNAIKQETEDKLVKQAKSSQKVNALSFDELVERMHKFDDK